MNDKNYFRLGLFILIAVLIAVALLVGLGSGRWLARPIPLETYFDESVQGLDIGSKVRYRGVVVGEVSAIGFTTSRYETDKPISQRHQYVLIDINLQKSLFSGKALSEPKQELLNTEIARGLRVKLAPQGLTGTSYLEIDYVPLKDNPPLETDWKPDQLYIPSARSTVSQIVTGAQDLLGKMQKLDLERTLDNLNTLLESANKQLDALALQKASQKADRFMDTLNKLPLAGIASDTQSLVNETRRTNTELQALIKSPGLQQAPQDIASAAQSARRLLDSPELASSVARIDRITRRLDGMTASRQGELEELISNLNGASQNLKSLLEKADQQPSRLLLSDTPPPYTPPKP